MPADPRIALDAVARVADVARTDGGRHENRAQGGRPGGARERAVEATAGRARTPRAARRHRRPARRTRRSASGRARMIQEMDDAEAAAPGGTRRTCRNGWRWRSPGSTRSARRPRRRTPRRSSTKLKRAWQRARAPQVDPETHRTASPAGWQSHAPPIDAHAQAEAEHQRGDRARRAARRAAFVALCDRVEALRGEDTPDEIEKARAEWEGMPGASAQELQDAELRTRFDAACRVRPSVTLTARSSNGSHARLAELSLEAERLSDPPARRSLPPRAKRQSITEAAWQSRRRRMARAHRARRRARRRRHCAGSPKPKPA